MSWFKRLKDKLSGKEKKKKNKIPGYYRSSKTGSSIENKNRYSYYELETIGYFPVCSACISHSNNSDNTGFSGGETGAGGADGGYSGSHHSCTSHSCTSHSCSSSSCSSSSCSSSCGSSCGSD